MSICNLRLPFAVHNLHPSDFDWSPHESIAPNVGQINSKNEWIEQLNGCHLNITDFVLNSHLWHKHIGHPIWLWCDTDAHSSGVSARAHVKSHFSLFVVRIVRFFSNFRSLAKFLATFCSLRMHAQNWNNWFAVSIGYLLGDFLVMPFLVEFRMDPSRLKLDCRTMFIAFLGGNGGGDGSFSCSIGLCLPQRPIIIFC